MRITRTAAPSSRDPKGTWDDEALARVVAAARRLSRSRLVLFWLEQVAAAGDEAAFLSWQRDLSLLGRDEIADIIHELGPAAGDEFLRRFG